MCFRRRNSVQNCLKSYSSDLTLSIYIYLYKFTAFLDHPHKKQPCNNDFTSRKFRHVGRSHQALRDKYFFFTIWAEQILRYLKSITQCVRLNMTHMQNFVLLSLWLSNLRWCWRIWDCFRHLN